MKYISTRNKLNKVSPSKAILDGIAADGGLYVPESFPVFLQSDLLDMADMDYAGRLACVMSRFLTDFSHEELLEYAESAEAKFDGDPCPLVKLDEGVYIVELFHGPTYAFKDMALSVMPYLLSAAKTKQKNSAKTLILVATSGDTGKAALEGFKDIDGIDIAVFYPQDGVSGVQKAQMTTTEGANVYVAGIDGNFDDAQTAVKDVFADAGFAERLALKGIELSSANSINIGRLIPQVAYYFSAYIDLLSSGEIADGEKIDFVVPTGNFGNILAAYYAKKSGLPINRLICASNKNNILTDFFTTGEYNASRSFYKTASPSMDILISSNLERFLFDLSGGDDKLISSLMTALKQDGRYSVSNSLLKACDSVISAGFADEKRTLSTIEAFYNAYEYVLDPHTAVAVGVFDEYSETAADDAKAVVVSTASPFKFASDVYRALTGTRLDDSFLAVTKLAEYTGLDVPDGLKNLEKRPRIFGDILQKQDIKDAVKRFVTR
ncbi:MAG: threonine synthase [Clostridiales bacterium]|jgi:threonine synthase|nr:threonine synthase [Clostridiales bacterium]